MRLLSVLEPSFLHVSVEDWHDEKFVAQFEQRWIDLIDALKDTGAAGLEHTALLSPAMEALIWDIATAPAWTTNRNAKQRLLTVFEKRLRPLMEPVDAPTRPDACTVPDLTHRPADDPWLQATLDLLVWAVGQAADTTVQLGVRGTDCVSVQLIADGSPTKTVPACHSYEELLSVLPMKKLIETSDAAQLPRIVELSIRRFVASNPERQPIYNLEYSDTFCRQFVEARKDIKPRIVDAIVARVTQVQKSAQADKGLKDEPLEDGRRHRRFRVTRDWRIHYSYSGPEKMLLETAGPHDLGL